MFEGSLLFRYAAEVKNRILWMWDGNPILMLFSDGGSDHRLTYEHVKLSLIALFKELELDLLIAACTAPGHGWANSVERTIKLFLRKMKNRATLFLNPFDYHPCEIYISRLMPNNDVIMTFVTEIAQITVIITLIPWNRRWNTLIALSYMTKKIV